MHTEAVRPAEVTTPMHIPVMADRVVGLLAPALQHDGAVAMDATVGLGGHAAAVLRACPRAQLIGLDRDHEALRIAAGRLAEFGDRVQLMHASFDEIERVVAESGSDGIDAALYDLGVSSLQLDQPERGFAYARDAPLDMRMDPGAPRTAADVVNGYSAKDLTRILREYGEERFAARIAARIVTERGSQPIASTARLAELVRDAIPAATRRHGGHPAKRSFQAIRIEVNGELDALRRGLPAAIAALRVGGRLVVMSYHSLEDRIAKRVLLAATHSAVPDDLPVIPAGAEPQLRLLTRGAETPSEAELLANSRAASVRLRAAERVRGAA